MKITVATSQFPVSASIASNLKHVRRHIHQAASAHADVVHFSELALSGYAGSEFPSYDGFDWGTLEAATHTVLQEAKKHHIWVILGSSHRLSGSHKPHNSLYIIDPDGAVADRYDKMFCTGGPSADAGDLAHYSPSDHFSVFSINGVSCGALICHDFRYQELYRVYCQRGVRLMFHSYHNGHHSAKELSGHRTTVGEKNVARNGADNIWGVIVPPTMQAYAANNHMWISANNTSARFSSWPSFFVRPDGVIAGRLKRNQAGLLISTLDTDAEYYDASVNWRERAMAGRYHSGELVADPRSEDRTHFDYG